MIRMRKKTRKTIDERSPVMSQALSALLDVMRRLREPEKGCPWDIQQDHKTLARCLLDESYEAVEAIENDDQEHLCEELGDVLFQVVFHAQIASESGAFTFDDIARRVADKMVERHPHVFGSRADVTTASDVLKHWEADKAKKRAEKAEISALPRSILDDVGPKLPAFSRALKLQQRAAQAGFDWREALDILAKVHEELAELEAEIRQEKLDAVEDELGDVLFVLTNLARRLKVDPESALRRTNRKFESRFKGMEAALSAQGRTMADASPEEKESLWNAMKAKENKKNIR